MSEELETEERVIAKIRQRREAGRAKYGKTMERTDIDLYGWLIHLQEELLDAPIYIERALKDVAAMRDKLEKLKANKKQLTLELEQTRRAYRESLIRP